MTDPVLLGRVAAAVSVGHGRTEKAATRTGGTYVWCAVYIAVRRPETNQLTKILWEKQPIFRLSVV